MCVAFTSYLTILEYILKNYAGKLEYRTGA